MKRFIFLFPFLLIGCSSENDEEVVKRAVNDEAMQLINQNFEAGNEDLYAEVDKQHAALIATRGDLPDYQNYNSIDSLFSGCKTFIDVQQEDFTADYCWPPFEPEEPYATSCVEKLRLYVNYDLSALRNKIIETISLAETINSSDTIYRAFIDLAPEDFEQVRTYTYSSFSSEIESVISDFETAYSTSSDNFEVIDVLEFFTLCRSTLLVAERKVIRFHCETLMPRSTIEIGDKLDALVLNKPSYSPGEQMEMDIYHITMCNQSFSRISWQIDSGLVYSTPYRQYYCMDTIPLPTNILGMHRVEVNYASFNSRFRPFQETFFYTVVEP